MPLIYNGQEVGGNQALDYFNDTKINWSSPDTKMLNTIRTLTALKHVVPALGDKVAVNWVTLSSGAANVLAFTRQQGDSEVLVVLNLAPSLRKTFLPALRTSVFSLHPLALSLPCSSTSPDVLSASPSAQASTSVVARRWWFRIPTFD